MDDSACIPLQWSGRHAGGGDDEPVAVAFAKISGAGWERRERTASVRRELRVLQRKLLFSIVCLVRRE